MKRLLVFLALLVSSQIVVATIVWLSYVTMETRLLDGYPENPTGKLRHFHDQPWESLKEIPSGPPEELERAALAAESSSRKSFLDASAEECSACSLEFRVELLWLTLAVISLFSSFRLSGLAWSTPHRRTP